MTDEGFHEIQLNGKQIVFLFMAATLVSVVIFLLGVFVGRGVQAQRAAQAGSPPSAAVPPPAEPAPTGAPGAASGAPAGGEGGLSYPQRLQGDKPVPESLKPEAAPPVAAEEPPPPEAPSVAPGDWVVQVAALRDRDAALAIVKRLSDKKYPAFLLEPAPGAPAPVYRVRVGRYPERAEAEKVARRLEREDQFKPLITR